MYVSWDMLHDGRTDGQTDGRTDGKGDIKRWVPHLKNKKKLVKYNQQ